MHNDLFKQLREEHQQVKQILLKTLEAPEGSRKNLLEELKLNLLPHMEGEEKAFYPVLSKKNGSSPTISGSTRRASCKHNGTKGD